MTARILAYSYNNRPAYLPNWDGVPVLVRDAGRSLLANWQAGRNPQRPDVREGHWGTRALGWVSELYEDETGLWARAELNPEGENLIVVQRAFGYVSPAMAWNLTLPSGEVVEGWSLLHVAVTNDPAQYGAAAIVLSRDGEGRSVLYAPAQQMITEEDSQMTAQELTEAIQGAVAPLVERLERLEQHVVRLTSEAEQRELERAVEHLQREIESWRFEGERVIPPALARQFAVLLARMPEPQRTEMLNVLRANPPLTVRLTQTAQPSQPEPAISALERKFMQQLGVSEEAYLRYNKEAS